MSLPFFKSLNTFKRSGLGFGGLAGILTGVALLVVSFWSLNQLTQPGQANTPPRITSTLPANAAGGPVSADTRIVLVSGRDDHGLLEVPHIPLYQAPNNSVQVSQLHDATFARVMEVRGNWMKIQTLAQSPETGWIDDYYLRGKALRLDGGGQVEFAAARMVGDKLFVAVYPVGKPGVEVVWLPPSELKEVGAVN